MSTESNSEQAFNEFFPVIFVRELAEAEFYKALLEDHDIVVRIGQTEDPADDPALIEQRGIAVSVSKEDLEEAEVIIEQRSTLEDEFTEEFEEAYEEEEDESYGDTYEDIEADPLLELSDLEDDEEMF